MVDTIIDNVSLRTQRKGELKLEISVQAKSDQLLAFLETIRKLIKENKLVEQSFVFLSDTGKNAHMISIEYFTGMQMSIDEFNNLRESINLSIIKKMEEAGVELASHNMDVIVSQK